MLLDYYGIVCAPYEYGVTVVPSFHSLPDGRFIESIYPITQPRL